MIKETEKRTESQCQEQRIRYKCDLKQKWPSLVARSVKILPAMWETQVQSLGWEDSLEKEMATHSGILAWKISWTEEPAGLQSTGLQTVSGKESAC